MFYQISGESAYFWAAVKRDSETHEYRWNDDGTRYNEKTEGYPWLKTDELKEDNDVHCAILGKSFTGTRGSLYTKSWRCDDVNSNYPGYICQLKRKYSLFKLERGIKNNNEQVVHKLAISFCNSISRNVSKKVLKCFQKFCSAW